MANDSLVQADEIIRRCRLLAECTKRPGVTTRTFLSPPMHKLHSLLREWMGKSGIEVAVDAAGRIRGTLMGKSKSPRRLLIGSHLDTVPNIGAFDGSSA
jgi:allantoate deiminase